MQNIAAHYRLSLEKRQVRELTIKTQSILTIQSVIFQTRLYIFTAVVRKISSPAN